MGKGIILDAPKEGQLRIATIVVAASCVGEVCAQRARDHVYGDAQILCDTFASFLDLLGPMQRRRQLDANMMAVMTRATEWATQLSEGAKQAQKQGRLDKIKGAV